jgi:hypothetical protein
MSQRIVSASDLLSSERDLRGEMLCRSFPRSKVVVAYFRGLKVSFHFANATMHPEDSRTVS